MKKWTVYGIASASTEIGEVEAETKDEAIEKGNDLPGYMPSLCYQCASRVEVGDINDVFVTEVEATK